MALSKFGHQDELNMDTEEQSNIDSSAQNYLGSGLCSHFRVPLNVNCLIDMLINLMINKKQQVIENNFGKKGVFQEIILHIPHELHYRTHSATLFVRPEVSWVEYPHLKYKYY